LRLSDCSDIHEDILEEDNNEEEEEAVEYETLLL
jgi:hypothetical protein